MSYKEIEKELKNNKGKGTTLSSNDSYINSGHFYYNISVPLRRKIAKNWFLKNKNILYEDFIIVVEQLIKGKSHEEKTIASILLGHHSKFREKISSSTMGLKQIETWLNELVGWAEIDSFCQNVFKTDEILNNWNAWRALIRKLSKSNNINKRRAALVFLIGPVHYSQNIEPLNLAFETITELKGEKEILITKAISWLLRSAVDNHKKAINEFIIKNNESLPKIAIRETLTKIRTGTKNKSAKQSK